MLNAILKSAGSALFVTFSNSATSTIATVTVPVGVARGDLLVLFDRAADTAGFSASVVPAGFTSVTDITIGTTTRFISSFKIANGTEGGTNITGMNGTNVNAKILLVFSTQGSVSGLALGVSNEVTDLDPAPQTISISNEIAPVVVLGYIRQQAATTQSFTPTQDGTVTNGVNYVFYKSFNGNPQNVTFDCGDGGNSNQLYSFYIRLT